MIRFSTALSINVCAMYSGLVAQANGCRLAAPLNDLLQRAHHSITGQGQINIDTQAFTIVIVNHIESAHLAAIDQCVAHEVDRPHLVDGGWNTKCIRPVALDASSGLDTQVQFQLPIDPVNTDIIPVKSAHVAQMQIAKSKSPAFMGRGERWSRFFGQPNPFYK